MIILKIELFDLKYISFEAGLSLDCCSSSFCYGEECKRRSGRRNADVGGQREDQCSVVLAPVEEYMAADECVFFGYFAALPREAAVHAAAATTGEFGERWSEGGEVVGGDGEGG